MNLERVKTYLPETLSIVRIIVALLFLEHGSAKLLGFPASPTPQPAVMTLLWAQGVIELIGGLLLAVGLFTRPVAFILCGDMAAAYFMAHRPQKFLSATQWWRRSYFLLLPFSTAVRRRTRPLGYRPQSRGKR